MIRGGSESLGPMVSWCDTDSSERQTGRVQDKVTAIKRHRVAALTGYVSSIAAPAQKDPRH